MLSTEIAPHKQFRFALPRRNPARPEIFPQIAKTNADSHRLALRAFRG
jgi:hypothetical protein